MHPLEAAKAFDHAGAGEAEQQPVHDEQAGFGGVEKEVHRFGFGNVLVGSEGKRIDAEERLILGGADVRFKLRNDARAPGASFLKLGQTLFP